MFECSIENEYGEILSLTGNKNYTVYQIDGLEPPQATINTSPVASFDGSRFNSSRTNERNVVVYLAIEGDCEANRINLYRYAKTKRFIKFHYKNDSRSVYIDGYVENMPIAFFDKKQLVQISILCPSPYFKSSDDTITNFSTIEPLFAFPFAYESNGEPFSTLEVGEIQSIINAGDIENGVVIQLQALGRAVNPRVYNTTNNEYIKLTVEMVEGDTVTINTNAGKKSIALTHDGVTTNIINSMDRTSSWFKMLPGDNLFTYDADEFPENIQCIFIHCDEFEGV